jgi:hypothetical protein
MSMALLVMWRNYLTMTKCRETGTNAASDAVIQPQNTGAVALLLGFFMLDSFYVGGFKRHANVSRVFLFDWPSSLKFHPYHISKQHHKHDCTCWKAGSHLPSLASAGKVHCS